MKLYRIMVFVTAIVISSSLIAFSTLQKSEKENMKQNVDKKPRIVLLSQIYNNPYWQIIKKGAERAAKERGCFLEYNGPQAASIDENLRLFDMAVNARVDGILTYVQDERKSSPYINNAVYSKIPVITLDADAPLSSRITYVGTDNAYAGRVAANVVVEAIKRDIRIGIIMGGNTTNQTERVEGFKEFIDGFPRASIVDTASSDSYLIEAKLVTERMLRGNPYINCLFCTSSLDGIGAAKAVQSLKRDDIIIVCFDDLPDTLELIKSGAIYASIVQDPYDMGYKGVNLMMDYIEKKNIKYNYLTAIKVIKKGNVEEYMREKGEDGYEK